MVSICTTTARQGFLDKQMRMLADQDYSDIEWVVVDFSYERNVASVKSLAKELGFSVTYLPNVRDNNLYFRDITRNRNKCLANAQGDYVIFLDDYAVIDKDFVSRHLDIMRSGVISAGLMHRLEVPEDNSEFLKERFDIGLNMASITLSKYGLGKDFRDRDGTAYKATGITYTGNLGIPRSIFESINGFDPRMESALEDCDFGARASIAGYSAVFNPRAYTVNLNTGNFPYVWGYDHPHDVEPFISNPNNNFRGDSNLKENDFIKVEFRDGYRVAHCKICGAKGMIDPNELINSNFNNKNSVIPEGLSGGYDMLKKEGENG